MTNCGMKLKLKFVYEDWMRLIIHHKIDSFELRSVTKFYMLESHYEHKL